MSDVHLNLIAGQWVGADETCENRNPSAPSDLIGLYASGGAEDVARAAMAASAAQTAWFNGGPQMRADVLDKIAALIEARAVEIGTMLAREEGKILPEAIAETRRAAPMTNALMSMPGLPPLLFVGFVVLANLATIWHGALFIALMPVLVWVFNDVLNWALADR